MNVETITSKNQNDNKIEKYSYKEPVKIFKQKSTRIKIVQDIEKNLEHRSHGLVKFLNQYNEFIKLVIKYQKPLSGQKSSFNPDYAKWLTKQLGMSLKKDAFMEKNLLSRENIVQIKERLAFALYKKLHDENLDLYSSDQQNGADDQEEDFEWPTQPQKPAIQNEVFMIPQNITYKYDISKGNNSFLVSTFFKNRFWWVRHIPNQ